MLLLILLSLYLVSVSLGAPRFFGTREEDIDALDLDNWHHYNTAEVHHQDDHSDNNDDFFSNIKDLGRAAVNPHQHRADSAAGAWQSGSGQGGRDFSSSSGGQTSGVSSDGGSSWYWFDNSTDRRYSSDTALGGDGYSLGSGAGYSSGYDDSFSYSGGDSHSSGGGSRYLKGGNIYSSGDGSKYHLADDGRYSLGGGSTYSSKDDSTYHVAEDERYGLSGGSGSSSSYSNSYSSGEDSNYDLANDGRYSIGDSSSNYNTGGSSYSSGEGSAWQFPSSSYDATSWKGGVGPSTSHCPQMCDLRAWPRCQCESSYHLMFTSEGRGNCNVGSTKQDLQVWCFVDPDSSVCPDMRESVKMKGRFWSRFACITETEYSYNNQ